MIHAGETVQRFKDNVGQSVVAISKSTDATRGWMGALRDFSIVVGAAGFALGKMRDISTGFLGDIVKVNAEMERLTVLMKSMSTAKDPMADAAKNVKFLRDAAKETPFSLQALQEVFVKLKATGIDPMSGALKALTDGVAGVGGTEEGLKRAALAISQMSGKGVIQMEELRQQLGETMPRAVELMARSMGVSMQTLIKEIGTGTVAAKPALEAFMREVSRVYGGMGKEMMQTFDGMQKLLLTNLQDLALAVGKAGFFDAVKAQLADLNTFLSGPAAGRFATSFGQMLTGAIESFRGVIDWIIKFRNEITSVLTVMAGFYALRIATGIIGSIAGSFAVAGAEVARLRVQYSLLAPAIAQANAQLAFGQMVGTAGAFGAVTTQARNLVTLLPIIASGFALVMPWVPLLAGAVMIAAQYFGLFSDKAQDAWTNLQKFGAESRKQAEEGSQFVKRKRDELAALEKERAKAEKSPLGGAFRLSQYSTSAYDQKIAALRKELDEMEAQDARNIRQGEDRDAQRGADKSLGDLARVLRDRQAITDAAGIERSRLYEKEVKEYAEANRSTQLIDKAFAEKSMTEAIKLHEDRLAAIDGYWDKARIKAETGSANEVAAAKVEMDRLAEMRRLEAQQLQQQRAQQAGIAKIPKPIADDELFKKGEAFLKSINAEIAGLKANLASANPAVAELKQLMADMKFGDPGIPKVQELIDKILEAKKAQQELDELVGGRKKYDAAVASERLKVEQEILEYQTKGLSGSEKIRKMMELGLFPGMGPQASEAQRRIADVRREVEQVDQKAKELARTFKMETFGDAVMAAADRIAKAFGSVGTALTNLANRSGGMDMAKLTTNPDGRSALGFTSSERDLMIRTIAGEAGGEIETGMVAVAQVIKNRFLGGFGGAQSLTDVIKQPKQFSVWNEGDPAGDKARALSEDSALYKKIGQLVDMVLAGKIGDPTGGAQHYLNPNTAGAHAMRTWFAELSKIARVDIGNHAFVGGKGAIAQANIPATPTNDTSDVAALRQREVLRDTLALQNAMTEKQREYDLGIQAAAENQDGHNKHLAAANKFIAEQRKLAQDKGVPFDEEALGVEKLIALAKKRDEVEKQGAETRKKLRKQDAAEELFERTAKDLDERKQAAVSGLADPQGVKYSEQYLALQRQLRRGLDDIADSSGVASDLYKQKLNEMGDALINFRNTEIAQKALGYARENETLRISLLGETQAREETAQLQIQRLQAELAAYAGQGEERVRIEQAIQQRIQLIRAQAMQNSPIGRMFKEWTNDTTNFQNQFVSMSNSATSAIADMAVTGKADFKGMTQAWAKELINLALKSLLAKLMGGVMSTAGGIFGSSLGAMSGGVNTLGVGGIFHTGGIIGDRAPASRMIDSSVFLGAPRFHTGGVIGRDEVPIIAQKGEGVFTAAQMKALGIMGKVGQGVARAMQVNAPITVNGSSGTREQNSDLAKQMGKQLEATMRSVVVDEMLKQRRPGNINGGYYAA